MNKSIVDWIYGSNETVVSEGVDHTLSDLRPILDYREVVVNLVDYLWGEDYNDSLEVTITLKESVLNTFTESYIKKMIKANLKPQFRTFLLADYSKVGRLHFHGVIKPIKGTKGLDYLRRKLTKIFGRTEIKPIREKLQWLTYMVKYYYDIEQEISAKDYITNDVNTWKIHTKHNLEADYKKDIFKRVEKHLISEKHNLEV